MTNQIMMILSIISRGKAKKYMDELYNRGIRVNMQTHGTGTASTEMKDLFGLKSNDKDIVISLGTSTIIASYINRLENQFESRTEYEGIMMCVKLSAINRLTSEIITNIGNKIETGGVTQMQNENKHQLILVSVNQGCVEDVMITAKKAGATGGTVFSARLAETEKLEQFGMVAVEDGKEIIAILSPSTSAKNIMEAINQEHGINTKANGIVLAVPVEKAYKI